jgi:hypothetical protein
MGTILCLHIFVNILPRKEEDIPCGGHKICVVKLFKELLDMDFTPITRKETKGFQILLKRENFKPI